MKLNIYRVIWKDAMSDDSWADVQELIDYQPPIIESIGFLIHEDKDRLVLTMNMDKENESSSMTMIIPRKYCLAIQHLKTIEHGK